MKYENIVKAKFLARPNRFVARVITEEEGEISVYVPNTGRCREIFQPNVTVYLQAAPNLQRKYRYTLYAAEKGGSMIQIDSAAANCLTAEALAEGRIKELKGATNIVREKRFANSRFDFFFQRGHKSCFLEVKGVTLEIDGVAKFPDAPTERGSRHLKELMAAREEGYEAYVLFVVQMSGIAYFTPNREGDPLFSETLKQAQDRGVKLLAYDALVSPAEVSLNRAIPIRLEK